ncbi:MAG: MBL fold metallo-hydrolase [Candidatus Algichlamydia australiensis]|nr:MBL fold metallo-hydrolase [Chlamydiales bacterium]
MVKVTLLNTGYCRAWGKIAVNCWSWQRRSFPAIVAMIEHPKEGIILFDTGYSESFFSATKKFPYRFYRWITPIYHKNQESVKHQLEARGFGADDVRAIFISHFHADHLCGLCDFDKAKFFCSGTSAREIKNLRGVFALRKGFLPDLLPNDFFTRTQYLENLQLKNVGIPNSPFEMGIDLFHDRSIVAIFLPGHAQGQMGLLIDQKTFLIADAVWNCEAVRKNIPPHNLAHLLHENKKAYLETFNKLHQLSRSHPEIRLVPTHCPSVLESKGGV